MKSKFENFLNEHRSSLDVDQPDDELIWSEIQAELKHKKPFVILSWKAAAIFLLALLCGFILNSVLNPAPRMVQLSLADIAPEYAEREQIYLASIQEKWEQINKTDFQRNDYERIFSEIDQLEELKAETYKDFEELGGNPRMVKTLFEYYEIKIRLLEIMLAEIDKNNNDKIKNQGNEKYY